MFLEVLRFWLHLHFLQIFLFHRHSKYFPKMWISWYDLKTVLLPEGISETNLGKTNACETHSFIIST